MAISGRLGFAALIGAVFVGVFAPSWTGILGVLAVLVAAAAVDFVLAGSVRALQLHRSGDRSTRLGETATVRLTVHNTGGRAVRGILRDAWVPSAGLDPDRFGIVVPPHERRVITARLRPTRRGDRRPARVTVRSFGPMGLAARQRSTGVPWAIRVLPPFSSRKHLPSRLARLRELDGRTLVMVRGQGTEFDSLRDYVVGDDVRAIDWRATARRQAVVVRTWRPERDRHVVIVLDTSRTSAGRIGDSTRLDTSMDAALLLAALATRAGDRVDLLAYDRAVRASVRGATGADVLPAFVNAMAPLEPALLELDARSLVGAILDGVSRRSLVVLLTSLDPAVIEQGLLPVIGPLVKRHQVIVASVADSQVDRMAAGRGDAEAVYAAAAAERTRADRGRMTDRLSRHTVEVVEGSPEALPPMLADTYLALKAAGRL